MFRLSASRGAIISLSLIALSALQSTPASGFTKSSFLFKKAFWKESRCPPVVESVSFLSAKKTDFNRVPLYGDSDEGGLRSEGSWKLRNDFYTFLNQCSIQSFLFLLKSMRDPQTVMWMENFTKPVIAKRNEPIISTASGVGSDVVLPVGDTDCLLLSYHGLNAINATMFPAWDSYFIGLIEHPVQTYIVESPFPRVPDYELEINPPRLCNRLMAVREQIAREFASDLLVLSNMGQETLNSYWKSVMRLRESGESKNHGDPDEKDGREIKIDPGNLMFLDLNVDSDRAPSPLRKGNFDLLKLLATQEAIHRVLNDPKRQKGPEKVANKYLNEFYSSRLLSCFDGCQEYGVADLFVRDLLKSPPILRKIKGRAALIDPTRLAEVILDKRKSVALEWKTLAELVPDEHLAIRRLQFDQLLGGMGSGGLSFEQALKGEHSSDKAVVEPVVRSSMKKAIVGVPELVACGMNETSVFE
ncbi:hypothetical protein ACA910_019688 [Epithemia clementina (nom. ined.)]